MKKIIFILLCLTAISMGEVNAQDSDRGKVFYGYANMLSNGGSGDDDYKHVLFITDVIKECDAGNYVPSRLKRNLRSYIEADYPNYYRNTSLSYPLINVYVESQSWSPVYRITFQRAYSKSQQSRNEIINLHRKSFYDDDIVIIRIKKEDFSFFQDACN